MNDFIYAFLLTLLAGLSTGIGGLIAVLIKKPRAVYLSFALGLSAGVMIYISFMELLPGGFIVVGAVNGLLLFFSGMLMIYLIDRLMPERENPHHEPLTKAKVLTRVGLFTALVLAIHNFPEGLATFASALNDVRLGGLIAVAIALHNIPEGIAVAMPVLYGTGSKKKAFSYSFLSGLAEPIGALIGYLVLLPFLSDQLIGGLMAFIAGVMIYISLDELIPTAHKCNSDSDYQHIVIGGVTLGMLIMAVTILIV